MSPPLAPLDLLTATVPDWFEDAALGAASLTGRAVVPVPGGATDFVLRLAISTSWRSVQVREQGTQRLPAFCPERHVNEGATFCLGYGAEGSVATIDDAVVWWELLLRFLSLQRVAERTGCWPHGHAIAHGEAGPHHVEARRIASGLGMLEAYDEGLVEGNHWSSDGTIRLARDGSRLLNGRAPCPIGCRRRRRARLRRECRRRQEIVELVRCDGARRQAEEAFWRELKGRGAKCCRTLRLCPLAHDDSAHADPARDGADPAAARDHARASP